MDGFQPTVTEAEDRLLEAAAEVAATAADAQGQRAVRAAVAEDEAGGGEGHALCLIGDRQQRAAAVAFVLDEQLPGHLDAGRFQPGIAVVAVGEQLDQRLLDRGEASGVDVDDALIHRNCVDGHGSLLARLPVQLKLAAQRRAGEVASGRAASTACQRRLPGRWRNRRLADSRRWGLPSRASRRRRTPRTAA